MLPQLTSGSDGVVRAQNIVLLLIANFNMALVVMQTKYLLVYLQQVFLDQLSGAFRMVVLVSMIVLCLAVCTITAVETRAELMLWQRHCLHI